MNHLCLFSQWKLVLLFGFLFIVFSCMFAEAVPIGQRYYYFSMLISSFLQCIKWLVLQWAERLLTKIHTRHHVHIDNCSCSGSSSSNEKKRTLFVQRRKGTLSTAAYMQWILRHDFISFKLTVGKEEMQSKNKNRLECARGKRTISSNCFLSSHVVGECRNSYYNYSALCKCVLFISG